MSTSARRLKIGRVKNRNRPTGDEADGKAPPLIWLLGGFPAQQGELQMTCKTCKFWNADGTQMVIALRGKCSESRADKISERTVFDYSCRYYQRRPTQPAPDAGDSAASSELVQASALSTSQTLSTPQRG